METNEQPSLRRLQRALKNYHLTADRDDLFGEAPPADLMTPYPFDWDEVRTSRAIQNKYADRARNIQRSWNRIQTFAPELLTSAAEPQKVFEMSTAHGGMLEVARAFGHTILGNDYLNFTKGQSKGEGAVHREVNTALPEFEVDDYRVPVPKDGEELTDWCYRPIIEAMEIPMALFDGGKTPYPLEDKSQDVLFCMQAIEHYCHPDHWMDVVDEFCRITRRSIVILLNKNPKYLANQPEYVAAFDRARRALRSYDRNGFRCVSVHMRWNQALGFKLMAA